MTEKYVKVLKIVKILTINWTISNQQRNRVYEKKYLFKTMQLKEEANLELLLNAAFYWWKATFSEGFMQKLLSLHPFSGALNKSGSDLNLGGK